MKLRFILFILSYWSVVVLYSQNSEEQEQLIETAADYFEQGQFAEAMPLYSQLLSIYPTEPIYSFYYGACLVENNKEIDKSIKYLSFATRKLEDVPLAFYYLGRAYHLSYQFDKAIEQYQIFQTRSSAKLQKDKQSEREIAICENGRDLVKYSSQLIVLDNTRIKQSNLQYAYKLDDTGGKIIVKPDDFKTKADLKSDTKEFMFVSDSGLVYFSSFGNIKDGQRDIYFAQKNDDGSYATSQRLSSKINSTYDEDFPFLSADGKALYFCSKGHNTMGGFDVFRSVFDSTAMDWSEPINLDFPTNTPYDDILYVVDKDDNFAMFASNRESQEEKLNVYKIQVDKNPVEREIKNVEEILQMAKLEVTPLADRPKLDTAKQAIATTEVAEFSDKGPRTNFNFDEVYEANINSSADYTSVLRQDIGFLERDFERVKAQKIIAANVAHQKLGAVREKQDQINAMLTRNLKLKSSDVEDLNQMVEQLKLLMAEANMATVAAKKLSEEAQTRERELNITQLLLNDSANNNTQELIQNINANRTFIQKNNESYWSINNQVYEKESELSKYNLQLAKAKDRSEAQKQTLDQFLMSYKEELKTANKLEDKTQSEEKIKSLNKDLELAQNKYSEVATQLAEIDQKAKSIKAEIDFLNQMKGDLNDKNHLENAKNIAQPDANGMSTSINQLNGITDSLQQLTIQITNQNFIDEQLLAHDIQFKEQPSALADANNLTFRDENMMEHQEENIKEETNAQNENLIAHDESTDELNESNKISPTTSNNTILVSETIKDLEAVKQKISTINPLAVGGLEAVKLYEKAQVKQLMADSLQALAKEKEERLPYLSNAEQQSMVQNEVDELKQLANIHQQQSITAYQQAQIEEKDYYKEHPEDTIVNKWLSEKHLKIEKENIDATTFAFMKAALASQYFKNQLKQLENDYIVSKYAKNSNELSDTEKQRLKDIGNNYNKEKEQLENYIVATEASKASLKPMMANKNIASGDETSLLAQTTTVKFPKSVQLNKEQQKQISKISKDQVKIDDQIHELLAQNQKITNLKKELEETDDEETKKDIQEEISDIESFQKSAISDLKEKIELLSLEEHQLYDELLDQQRRYRNDDKVTEAFLLEAESELFEEKAVAMQQAVNESFNEEAVNLQMLKSAYELNQLSANKERAAIALYATLPEDNFAKVPDQNLADNITEPTVRTNKQDELVETPSNDINTADYMQLLPDEEERVAAYTKLQSKAESQAVKSQNYRDEWEIAKRDLERTYLAKDKPKQEEKVKIAEIKAKNQSQLAFRTLQESHLQKYNLYQQKIETALSVEKEKPIKSLARQYLLDAQFYREEADKIKPDSTQNIFDLQAQQQQYLALDAQALKAQEEAVRILSRKEQDEFVSNNTLVKIDPLLQQEKPIDKKLYQKIQTERLISLLDLTPQEAKSLKKTDELEDENKKLEQSYQQNKAEIDFLSDSLTRVKDPKDWEKLDARISEMEEKSLSYLFNIAQITEPINFERYTVYKNHLNAHRLNDQSQKAIDGRTLEKEANKAFRKAQNLRQRSFESSTLDRAYQMLIQAQELEAEAIDNMERAYAVYLDLAPIDAEVEKYIAENTDTNTVGIHGYQMVESDGQVEAYTLPEIVEPEQEDTMLIAENLTVTPVDTLSQPVEQVELTTEVIDTLNVEMPIDGYVDITSPTDTINNEPEHEENNQLSTVENESDIQNETSAQNEPEKPTITDVNTNVFIADNSTNDRGSLLDIGIQLTNQNIYNDKNPIPLNNQLPDGIVYKIQIGAFTRPIANTSFKGLSPITGETRQNSKYIRYFVGLFDTYEAASVALPHIKRNGYSDAFIVAYKNGQRVAVYLAKPEDQKMQNYSNLASIESKKVQEAINQYNVSVGATTIAEVINETNPSVDLSTVKTTMYTVQIGVYKNHVSHARLYNLTPLFNDITASGLIRYTVGQFVDYNKALAKRDEIRQLGIKDAFVTAYKDGQRIGIATARQELAEVSSVQAENKEKETDKPVVSNSVNFNVEQLYYRVQIGAYTNSVPVEEVTSLLQLSKLDQLDQFIAGDGKTIYTLGRFKSLKEAGLLKQELIDKGMKDAFIIAFDGQRKVSIEEAKKVLQP
ncbi:MAG: PD40 domain-containing protein [Bacteroidales bacterium]|nr:PD40 domain-containing protein [Bacteroidales bacterium]